MAGVGKTAFAVHAAHLLASRFPDGQIFHHLQAHTAGQLPTEPAEALAALLSIIGVAPQRIPPGEHARSALWRELLADKQVLLVLDDAAGSDQIRPLLPGTPSCLVLVTSRRQLTGLEDAAPVTLDTLTPGQAADLLACLADRPGPKPGDSDIAEISRLCGYLPLAIRLVAARIKHHPAWTVAAVGADLAAAHDRLTGMQAEKISVTAAFDLSYRDLTSGQQRLFQRLGLQPGAEIDACAAAALDGISLNAAKERLTELAGLSLINETAPGRYRLHDLLREYARVRAGRVNKTNRAAITRLLNYYQHAAMTASHRITWRTVIAWTPSPSPRPACLPPLDTETAAVTWLKTEHPNLRACVDYALSHAYLEQALAISATVSDYLRIQGHCNEALALSRAGLEAARIVGNQEGEAGTLNQMGIAQELTGSYQAAAESQTKALQLFRRLGDRHGQACVLNQLGLVQWLTGKLPAAAKSQSKALRLFRRLNDPRGQAWALNQQGAIKHLTGKYEEAKRKQYKALRLFDKIDDRRGHAWARHDIGVVQRLTGDYPAAAVSQNQAMAMFDEIGDRQGKAWSLNQLGVVQCLTGDYRAATASQSEARDLFEEIGDRRGHAWTLHDMGVIQRFTEQHQAALETLTRALQLFRELGDQHGQAEASINLGDLRSIPSPHPDARSYYASALSISRNIKAPREEARALEGLGQCFFHEANPREGTAYLERALTIYRRIEAPEIQRAERALLNGMSVDYSSVLVGQRAGTGGGRRRADPSCGHRSARSAQDR
jgi:tetratricopeptide (TPR) repeat protein